ncbi:MAG: dienelactone hydrolase family protein [Bdellovibrionota bacterium]
MPKPIECVLIGIMGGIFAIATSYSTWVWAEEGLIAHSSLHKRTLIRFPVQISENENLKGTLSIPKKINPGIKLPVLLIFGGFEDAAHVLDLVRTDFQIALASFDYPFEAPRRFEFPSSLKFLPEAKALFPKSIRGIAELVKILKKRSDIDPKRVTLLGASFGAPFAVAAAAYDPSIAGLVVVHGFGLGQRTLENVLLRSWIPRLGWIAHPLAWIASRLGWYYLDIPAPESLARLLRANQSVFMITAEKDSFIPREAADALWTGFQNSGAQVTRTAMPTDHLMPGSDKIIDEIIKQIERWMSARGLS